MKRVVLLATMLLVVACASLLALPTTARVDRAADLQMTAGGSEGLAAAPLKCKRQRDRCPISNSSGCDC